MVQQIAQTFSHTFSHKIEILTKQNKTISCQNMWVGTSKINYCFIKE